MVREKWHCRVSVRQICRSGERWQRAVGDVAVFGEGDRPRVLTGDRVEMLAKVRANAPPSNPGEEDFRRIFERTGSFGTAGVSSGRAVRVLDRPAWYSSPSVLLGRLRGALKQRLVWDTDRGADPLTAALIFGERGGLTRDRWELMAEAGSVHFLAISGLHVGIFAAFMWWLLLQCRVPVGWRSAGLIVLVWLYVLFMGGQVSARRAAWMVSFLAAAPLLHRQSDPISALLGA
jgi:competence protein ComEC